MIPDIKNKTANLHHAKFAKEDEFYTKYSDIEKEVRHYEKHFFNKVVYCNCDDPAHSNFVKFFRDNYQRLGLRGLLTNHLCPDGSGDFRGREAVAKLAGADIVVTNPPFSLFRQFIAQLTDPEPNLIFNGGGGLNNNKKFLVIGNLNSISCRDIFAMFRDKKIWAGVNIGSMEFKKPDGSLQSFGNAIWFTNLEHDGVRLLKLNRKYDPNLYPKFDNYSAINVDKLKEIPFDYLGVMGVPLTFMVGYKWHPFNVVGATECMGKGFSNGLWDRNSKTIDPRIGGNRKYKRVFIQSHLSAPPAPAPAR